MITGRQLMEAPPHGETDPARRAPALSQCWRSAPADAEAMMERYPHQPGGSSGQIAMALITQPALLIMDEPTTGLDVTVEAAVLDLVRELRQRHNSAILFISHNLGTVVRVCDRSGCLRGRLVETAPSARFQAPAIPIPGVAGSVLSTTAVPRPACTGDYRRSKAR
jgi:peptide/nickel transport system ATP-binding protein